jgi:glycosyltransferase involved in cell wall biosynthesis
MMCRTPIIVNGETTMADIVREENCGIIVPYSDELALKKAILELKNNLEMCKKMGENGRGAFRREYNWEIMEERLLKLYANLIDNRLIRERDFDENG